MKKLIFIVCAVAAWCAFGVPPLARVEREKRELKLRINMRSSVASMAQVFFDLGQGFREPDSAYKDVLPRPAFEDLDFAVLPTKILAIRFDPFTTAGEMTVGSAALINGSGKILHQFALEDFAPGNQIKSLQQTPEGLKIVTDTPAPDPWLKVKLASPLDFSRLGRLTPGVWAKILGGHALAALCVVGLAMILDRALRRSWGRDWLNFSLPPGEEIEWIPVALYLYMGCVLAILAASTFYLEQMLFKILL